MSICVVNGLMTTAPDQVTVPPECSFSHSPGYSRYCDCNPSDLAAGSTSNIIVVDPSWCMRNYGLGSLPLLAIVPICHMGMFELMLIICTTTRRYVPGPSPSNMCKCPQIPILSDRSEPSEVKFSGLIVCSAPRERNERIITSTYTCGWGPGDSFEMNVAQHLRFLPSKHDHRSCRSSCSQFPRDYLTLISNCAAPCPAAVVAKPVAAYAADSPN